MLAHQAMDLESLNPVLHECQQRARAYPADDFGTRWTAVDRLEVETFRAETGIAMPADYGDFMTISTAHSAGHSGKVENP